jgi:hypothetical protein
MKWSKRVETKLPRYIPPRHGVCFGRRRNSEQLSTGLWRLSKHRGSATNNAHGDTTKCDHTGDPDYFGSASPSGLWRL